MRTRRAIATMLLIFCLRPLAACEPATDHDDTAGLAGADAVEQEARRLEPQSHAGFGFVASEFLPIDEVEAALPLLARHDVDLVIAWPAAEIDNPRWYEVVRSAQAQGVNVGQWLTLSESDGYFANSTNATLFAETMRRLVERWLAEGLAPSLVVVDMEMPIARTHEYLRLAKSGDVGGLTEFLRAGIDRPRYAAATEVYRELVDWLHARGVKVEFTALPLVLDDYDDGDDGLRQGLQVPVDGIAWDRYTFQIHRTLLRYALGELVGPHSGYYVYDCARRARARFGDRAAAYVGLTDPGIAPDVTVYDGPSELREDVDAALLAGLSREHIAVFSLRGLLNRPADEQWFPPASRFAVPPLPDAATALARLSSQLLDGAL